MENVFLTLSILFALSSFGGAVHLTINDRLSRVVSHPAFAGFGRLIVPWDSKVYDETMRLRDIGALLPYHTHVSLRVVVSALNRLIDDATIGKAIFHEVYSTSDREADPTRKDAGLFFFRGEPGAPFALICPGGGFSYVASVHEGFPYAAEINKRGFNAFVLKYRTGRGSAVATQDLVVSLDYIVRHASRLGVSTTGYSLWGSSAGARMVATIGSHGTGSLSATGLLKPSAVVMAYTGHADVGPAEPATFAIVGERDTIASPSIMNKRIKRVRQSGAPVEFHVYPGLGHGFGLGIGTGAEGWLADAIRFWSEQIKRG